MSGTIRKVLGQAYPAAGALANIYEAPAARSARITTLKVCNQSNLPTAFRVAVAAAGAADAAKQYAYYDVPIDGNDTFSATEDWTLSPTDIVRARSGNGACSFMLFGEETG